MWFKWDSAEVNLVSAGRARWRKNVQRDATWSGRVYNNDLWVIWAGEGYLSLGEVRYELKPGSILWMQPDFFYDITQSPDNPLGMDFIHFAIVDKNNVALDCRHVPVFLYGFDDIFIQHLTKHIIELIYFGDISKFNHYELKAGPRQVSINTRLPESGDTFLSSSYLLRSLLIDLDHFNSVPDSGNNRATDIYHRQIVMKAALRIKENTSSPSTIDKLAKEAGYNLDHFSRIFKGILGISPRDYMINVRIKRAEHMLDSTGSTIEAIALELGYCDKYFFSKQFKARTGLSPREYRKRNVTC